MDSNCYFSNIGVGALLRYACFSTVHWMHTLCILYIYFLVTISNPAAFLRFGYFSTPSTSCPKIFQCCFLKALIHMPGLKSERIFKTLLSFPAHFILLIWYFSILLFHKHFLFIWPSSPPSNILFLYTFLPTIYSHLFFNKAPPFPSTFPIFPDRRHPD